ncbi:hypothetical protein AVEN_24624-1 [Araneus ventricosus]|uniref:Uncharacterized protein n=1 Tax=Araneus ventricosus TaxID=182803 RepID=A0A4Y2TAZ1_ARAVE|nr:hypothetical protein AVEN_24624-1 [Araneus ventricosus]
MDLSPPLTSSSQNGKRFRFLLFTLFTFISQRLCRWLLLLQRFCLMERNQLRPLTTSQANYHLIMIGGSPRGWGGYSLYKTSSTGSGHRPQYCSYGQL